MKWHRTALVLAIPALLAAGVATALQDDAPAPAKPTEPAPVASPSPAPEVKSSPETAKILAAAADTGRFLTIPNGSLDTLTQRLKEKNGKPLVVVQYGDSHTQAGILSRELRDAFAQGGVTSPGYVAPGLHNVGDAHATIGGRWKASNWLKGDDDGSYGPLGAAWVTRDARARVHLHLKTPAREGTTVTALYYRSPRHAPFRLFSNDQLLTEVVPAPKGADMHVLGHAKVVLPAGSSDLDLTMAPSKAGGELRFFGFLVEVPGAVVEWDALGIQGASIDHPLNRGDSTIEEYLALRQPDLVVVWFGSNSLVAPNFDPVTYGKTVESFLARLKAVTPQAARLVLGPPDLARRKTACPTLGGGTVTKVVKVGKHTKRVTKKRKLTEHERAMVATFICQPDETVTTTKAGKHQYPIRSIQTAAQWGEYLDTCQNMTLPSVATCTDSTRDAAQRQGYAFFDIFAFMDGPGSIHRWACQQPALARFDHVHLTPDGYTTVGQGIWAAMLAKLPTGLGLRTAPKAIVPKDGAAELPESEDGAE